jgi:sulfur-carrier protein
MPKQHRSLSVWRSGFRISSFIRTSGIRNSDFMMIRVVLPFHLRNLARVDGEVQLEVAGPVTLSAVLDALEARYPVLRGTIRDHATLKRRPFVRFFACKEDWSNEPPEAVLPEAVATGAEPFLIVGAMAGG